MIRAINNLNAKPSFRGTTIVKKEGSDFLTKEIIKASDYSRPGAILPYINGYNLVIVSNVFEKEEQNFLKHLKSLNIDYVNSSKVLN